jgi:hypothetical protein
MSAQRRPVGRPPAPCDRFSATSARCFDRQMHPYLPYRCECVGNAPAPKARTASPVGAGRFKTVNPMYTPTPRKKAGRSRAALNWSGKGLPKQLKSRKTPVKRTYRTSPVLDWSSPGLAKLLGVRKSPAAKSAKSPKKCPAGSFINPMTGRCKKKPAVKATRRLSDRDYGVNLNWGGAGLPYARPRMSGAMKKVLKPSLSKRDYGINLNWGGAGLPYKRPRM